ncbi:fructose PTS transporter subunit IIA [Niallia sp. Krafla_26]|uniref:fructose PTS transporter subunit IIA n=1 Tax=Niallia sp. Krafla_26 TaxID=3064703 RepID=UPI003D17658F
MTTTTINLDNILDRNLIHVNVKASSKKEVLELLASKFLENNYITSSEEYLEDVYKREEAGVTGIGNYVAIPHGRSAAVEKVGAAIVILDEEVEWESLDETGAKIVILFAVGNDNEGSNAHLKLLAAFARKLATKM